MSAACAAALSASLLVSCAAPGTGGGTEKRGTSESTAEGAYTTRPEPLDERIEELDFGGRTVTILSRANDSDRTGREILSEELTNDPVNDAIFNRNAYVCEVLGLKEIKQVVADGAGELQDLVGLMVNSGDQTYDIAAASVYWGTMMLQNGYMYNLLSNGIDDYLDPYRPWWAQYWVEQAEVAGRLYSITGAPALSLTRMMFVFYYNKAFGEDLGIEDMYTVVNEGRWTIDYLNELIAPLYLSVNGDDVRDETDRYGLAINHFENCDTFWSSFDMTMIERDEEGWFEYSSRQQEKIANAFEKVFYLIRENPGTYDTGSTSGFDVAKNMFASGNTLFASIHLMYAETPEFRNMQSEYGILPAPKYNEEQKDYFTYAHDQYTIFMVPCTVADPALCGAFLETMAYESYYSVQPTYYDLVLKGRYANDPQSRAMLDLITSHFRVDTSWIYGIMIGEPEANVFRELIEDGLKKFASAWATQEGALPPRLARFRRTLEGIEY